MPIGFIGLGMMGAGMASNLQKAGHKLVVHDLRRQSASHHLNAGADWAESPRVVAEQCDVVFTSLPAPPDVLMSYRNRSSMELDAPALCALI